jgi:hypothetical protein
MSDKGNLNSNNLISDLVFCARAIVMLIRYRISMIIIGKYQAAEITGIILLTSNLNLFHGTMHPQAFPQLSCFISVRNMN